jgi:CheY-like chemotaxis protein
MLRRLIGEDVQLVTTLDPNLWPVRCDAGQIEQVLMNLAVNARDAMPGGGKLTIETQNIDLDAESVTGQSVAAAGPYVMISMTDNGAGIPPEIQSRIFDPFFTTKGPGKGTGLGLATVYGVLKQNGGHIAVYSEFGLGTTFKVYLPRTEVNTNGGSHVTQKGLAIRGTETILLVEDEEGVRRLARTILTTHGYSVMEAEGGEQALTLVRDYPGRIDLLVTDVVMPGMGGRLVAEQVKALHPEVRVLFMSGYTDDAVVRHGILVEGVHFLQKPFSPNALVTKVRTVLDKTPAE